MEYYLASNFKYPEGSKLMAENLVWVQVNDEVSENLAEAADMPLDFATEALAQSALYHVAYVMGTIPDAVKGKIAIDINQSATAYQLTYQTKAGGEAATITHKSVFIPETKFLSARRPPIISRSGESGHFLAGLKLTGRPSIEAFAMLSVAAAIPQADAATQQHLEERVLEEVKLYFESHNIRFNEGLGRYVAGAGGGTLPGGVEVPGGQIVSGRF